MRFLRSYVFERGDGRGLMELTLLGEYEKKVIPVMFASGHEMLDLAERLREVANVMLKHPQKVK